MRAAREESGGAEGEGVADVLEVGGIGEQVDGEDVKAHGQAGAMASGELREPGGGHAAELALLGGVDLGFGGEEIAGGAGFDFEDDERVAVPGDEVEVSAHTGRNPAAGDDGVSEGTQVEEGVVFAEFADEEMAGFRWFTEAMGAAGDAAVGEGAKPEIEAAFESKKGARRLHEVRIAAKGAAGTGAQVLVATDFAMRMTGRTSPFGRGTSTRSSSV